MHDLSREADPQLHVHCVVMNMTQRSDGHWRSLASQMGDYSTHVNREVNGFIERVRHHERYFGEVFQAELAYELKQLGYSLRKTKNGGLFEIEGISQKSIEAYSRRSKQIEEYMQEFGFSGAKAAAVATLKTRPSKGNIDRDTVNELWKMIGNQCKIDAFAEAKACVDRSKHPENHTPENSSHHLQSAQIAVIESMKLLSQTQMAIKEIHLVNKALQVDSSGNINISSVMQSISDLKEQGDLIVLETKNDEAIFTTKELIEQERSIIYAAHQKHERGKAFVDLQKINVYLSEQPELNREQKQAIRTLLGSSYQIGILEGSAHTGKTHLLKPLMELAKHDGYHTIMLTPNRAENIDLKSQLQKAPTTLREWIKNLFNSNQYATVTQFVKSPERFLNTGIASLWNKKTAIFVDSANLLASTQLLELTRLTEKTGARLIITGDKKSLLPWQTGTPFSQMIEQGAVCATLTQAQQQRSSEINAALADTLEKNIAAAFEKVGHRVFSVANKEQRLEVMAAHYGALTSEEREKTFVLMPSKAQCEEINTQIRSRLKQNGVLAKEGLNTTVLLPKSMGEAEYRLAASYEKGQWVRFNESYASLKVQKCDYLKIVSVQAKQSTVHLENSRGKIIVWDPRKVGGSSGKVEVFEEKQREIVVGEILTWKRNHPTYEFHNGERLKVEGIKGNKLTLLRDNQKKITIHLNELTTRHFDYGYSATPPLRNNMQKQIRLLPTNPAFHVKAISAYFIKHFLKHMEQVDLYRKQGRVIKKSAAANG